MSSKSKQSRNGHVTTGAFGGKKGKIRRAQKRFMANRQLSQTLPGARKK